MLAKIAKINEVALKAVLYLVLITPLLVSSKYLFPFISTKTFFFRILIEIAIFLYLTLIIFNKKFLPKFNKLIWVVMAFFVIIVLTGLTGVDVYKTFWGTIERGEGILTLFHLFAYFLLLVWTFKSSREWHQYLTALCSVGWLVSLYGLLQSLQIKEFLFLKNIINSGESRIASTIGNAAFLAAYSLLNFWLNLFLFFKYKKWWKIPFALGALLSFYIMFQTQTRGALLAWLSVIVVMPIFYAFKSPQSKHKKIAWGILILIILSSLLIWFNRESNFVQNNSTLHRIVTISRNDITTEARLLSWHSSWSGWRDKFILGYGWENYNIVFNTYFPPEIYKDAGSQLWFDRAHNTIFDVAVATGVFGLIIYLGIFVLALYYLFKQSRQDLIGSTVLSALLIAHFIQNIFVFDVLVTFIILFVILAYIAQKEYHSHNSENEIINEYPKKLDSLNYLSLTTLAVLLVFAIYLFNIKPAQANKLGIQGLISANQSNEALAIDNFKQGIDLQTYQTMELRHKLADNVIFYNNSANNLTESQIINNYNYTITQLKKNIEEHPLDVQNHLYLMSLLNMAGRYNTNYYKEVVELGERALKLSPTRAHIYFEMGQAEVNLKNYEQGIEYFIKGKDINPKNAEVYWNLFAAYSIANQPQNAQETLNKVLEIQPDYLTQPRNLEKLYNIYALTKNYQKMAETLQKMAEINPNGSIYARLAAIYRQLGNYSAARQAVQKAVELDPSLSSEAQIFLQQLDQLQK